jgi:hypothetical protein
MSIDTSSLPISGGMLLAGVPRLYQNSGGRAGVIQVLAQLIEPKPA